MTEYDACELAYKCGYEQGKKDAVVHCKDCKHYDFSYPMMKQPWGTCKEGVHWLAKDCDDYCKRGERKTNYCSRGEKK